MEAHELKKASVHFKMKYIQQKLKVNKSRGKGHDANAQVTYEYRNSEDILEAVKPLCDEVDAYVKIEVFPLMLGTEAAPEVRSVGKDKYGNEILALVSGPRFVASARSFLVDCVTGESVHAESFAAIDFWRKGQTEPEKLSGSADSYATKYALQHLFALDNGRDDPDGRVNETTTPPAPRPTSSTKGQAAGSTSNGQAVKKPSKAIEAWKAFMELGSVKSMTKDAREAFWRAELKSACGKENGKELSDADWDKVINAISIAAAM